MSAVLACALATWSPRLGDNNVMGWVTVAVYVLAALASARTAMVMAGAEGSVRRERAFWVFSAFLMGFLAVNKQLDLQSLFTAIGRCHARMNGWYDMRGAVQSWFILGVGLAALIALALLGVLMRGLIRPLWPALLGLVFVSLFVLIRAASFHQIDALIGFWLLGVRMNWVLELPGPILVFAVALRRSAGL